MEGNCEEMYLNYRSRLVNKEMVKGCKKRQNKGNKV